MNKSAIKVSFDNAGGITLNTDKYFMYYDSAEQAAGDVLSILSGANPHLDGWDGHDENHKIVPHFTSNLYGLREIRAYIKSEHPPTGKGAAEDEFWLQLRNYI